MSMLNHKQTVVVLAIAIVAVLMTSASTRAFAVCMFSGDRTRPGESLYICHEDPQDEIHAHVEFHLPNLR